MNTTRRDFLRITGAGVAATQLAPAISAWNGAFPTRDDRRLVLLFLEGGNDGLNTVVPFADDLYHRARPRLALRGGGLVRLSDECALHPSLAPLRSHWDEGRVGVLQGVGYERPDRSHFLSRDIWHSGQRAAEEPDTGWVARALATTGDDGGFPPVALGVAEAPLILQRPGRTGLTLRDLSAFQVHVPGDDREAALDALDEAATGEGMDARAATIGAAASQAYEAAEALRTAVAKIPAGSGYPGTALARELQLVARLVRAEGGPKVFWLRLGGFDTHAVQAGTHAALLAQLGGAAAAFLDDLGRDGAAARTQVLVYSEFGRRVAENGSGGTDHGAAAPMLALGGGVKPGVHGGAPDLATLVDGDIAAGIDFRAVFSEALAGWLEIPTKGVFDGAFADGKARAGYLA